MLDFRLERMTQPEIEAVTLAEMRRHLREYDDLVERDTDIEALIVAAREWVEDYTGRVLIDSTWRLTLTGDIIPPILLRKSPVIAITSFVSVGSGGAETAIDPDIYELRDGGSKWPTLTVFNSTTWEGATLRITFRAGFADRTGSPTQGADVVPERFKTAMKCYVKALYDEDKDMMPILMKVAESVIRPEITDIKFA